MIKIPAIVEKRLKTELPKFQKILKHAQQRDVNEADTVAIIADMLEAIFGFDKYEDITREFAINNIYVDLAIKISNDIDYLIEAKAIGVTLKENHLRQAVEYASKKGVSWAILTNGIVWQAHRVKVDGKVTSEEVFNFNILEMSNRNSNHLSTLFLLCKRGIDKGLMDQYYEQTQCFNGYVLSTFLQSETISKSIRALLRKITPGLKVELKEISEIIRNDLIRREYVESDNEEGKKLIDKTLKQMKKLKIN